MTVLKSSLGQPPNGSRVLQRSLMALLSAHPQCTVCTVPEIYFDEFVTKCTVLLLMYGIVRFRDKMCTVCTVILEFIYVRYCR